MYNKLVRLFGVYVVDLGELFGELFYLFGLVDKNMLFFKLV